jgi:hypothetical protein
MVDMKNFLLTTALLEASAGIGLLFLPDQASALLLSPNVVNQISTEIIARIAGAALLTLGAANWFSQYDTSSNAARGLAGSMIIYNVGTVGVLTMASFQLQPVGAALWPAVALHSAMSVWSIAGVLRKTNKS